MVENIKTGTGTPGEIMYYCGLLFAAALLGGCKDGTSPPATTAMPASRVVATVYAVHTDTGSAPCYRDANAGSLLVTHLLDGQLADLYSPQEKVIRQDSHYWLRIYPRLGHRPACYINVSQLVPVS
jgi:hypothetical protein